MSSIGKIVRLGEVAKVISGYAFRSADFKESGIPIIKIANVRLGSVDLSDTQFVAPEFLTLDPKYHVKYGDILISLTGSHLTQPNSVVGRVAFFRDAAEHCLLNQRAGKIIVHNAEVCDCRFLFYALSTTERLRSIATMAHGAASQANVSPTQVEDVKVFLPAPRIQRRIASILSAYDDLIENNTRRIKILEEMTQMIYREWFVNFRFPGHEKAKMVESELGPIPEGWAVEPMKNVAEVIDCLHSKKPDATEGGPGLLLQLFNIADGGKLDLTKQYRITKEQYEQWTSRIEVQGGDCVVTNVGRIGAVAQIPNGLRAAIGRNMTAIRPKIGRIAPAYLIEYLLSPYMASEVALKKDAGTIMDSLNVKGIVKLSVPVPPPQLMKQYEANVEPMRRRIEMAVEQKLNLCTTRDFLLPKLISGEIPVEAAEETAIEAATTTV